MRIGLYHVQLMRYYDEVLAQAARNYAFTGDKRWEIRYREVEPMSADLLNNVISNTDESTKPFFVAMHDVNAELVKIEYQSMDLVNAGKREQAVALLDGKECTAKRKILSGGLEDFIKRTEIGVSSDNLTDVMIPSVQQIVELERKLAVLEDNLKKEKLFAIGELSARLAHDIRNPLSVIKTSIDVLISQKDVDSKTMEMYDRMQRAGERITYQIDEVLNFVKPQISSLKNTSLHEILASVLARMEIPETVVVTIPPNNIEFVGDVISLEIVFVNLITNAIQAINNSGEIVISSEIAKEKIIIKIRDNGPGIPNNIIPQIFEPLFTTKQTGTGLGLTSCKTIIEQHGGHIDVESTVGKGTTFTITIPYRRIM